jgi:hypothetical protein
MPDPRFRIIEHDSGLCGSCEHWWPRPKLRIYGPIWVQALGECRRYPPATRSCEEWLQHAGPEGTFPQGVWPLVPQEGSCGEYSDEVSETVAERNEELADALAGIPT